MRGNTVNKISITYNFDHVLIYIILLISLIGSHWEGIRGSTPLSVLGKFQPLPTLVLLSALPITFHPFSHMANARVFPIHLMRAGMLIFTQKFVAEQRAALIVFLTICC